MVKYGDMAEPYITDRILFQKGQQTGFILSCKQNLQCSWVTLSMILNVNTRTLRDWSKEVYKMPYSSAILLSQKTKISLPQDMKIIQWNDHLKEISHVGGTNRYKMYGSIGDETKRKEAWSKWWEKEGKFKKNKILQRKHIVLPKKDSLLAEFVGIMMGDGGISNFTISITLDTFSDKDYITYVTSLLANLFGTKPKLYIRSDCRATNVVVQRRNVVDFCKKIGLRIGHKLHQNLDMPNWVKKDRNFSIACIRGLVDTDGCFFQHSYRVNNKKYTYTKIAFTSASPLLRDTVKKILINLGFCVRISRDGKDIRIDGQKDVQRYIELIGTNNPKNHKRIISRRGVGVVERTALLKLQALNGLGGSNPPPSADERA